LKQKIMHMFFPGKNVSPFDVNMIADSGYSVIIPYCGLGAGDVTALTQDCIYSRPPGSASDTGIFIGGYDVNLAEEMFKHVSGSMQSPFEVSVMVDPNGAYTTSAALVALISTSLQANGLSLKGSQVTIFGGGPVGNCAAVLAAQNGASVRIARLTEGNKEKLDAVDNFLARYNTTAEQLDARTDEGKLAAMKGSQVLISSAKAGIEILSESLMKKGCEATVAADVNAVPPAGIAGVGLQDAGTPIDYLNTCSGIGALAIGNIKYQTQQKLLKSMLDGKGTAKYLGVADAYKMAIALASKTTDTINA